MKFENKIRFATEIIQSKLSGQGKPVALRWNLTNRCNLNCIYCNLPERGNKEEELSTDRIKNSLDEMAESGVQRISFSGGEPLLREDIGEIIDYASQAGISPTMNSNGTLIPEKVDRLENLDLLKISIDGKKETHNRLRGSYEQVIQGLEEAIDNGIKTTLCTTFTKENYKDLKNVINLAEKYNTVVAIQRVTDLYENFEEAKDILPERKEIKSMMDEIIEIKNQKQSVIRNSKRHLELIRNYPQHHKLACTAGKLFCVILPDGTVTPCDRIPINQELPNLKDTSFDKAFKELERVECNGCCFCGSMELNYLYHLKLDVLKDLFNFV